MSVLANSQSLTPSPSRKRHRVAASALDTLLEAGGCVRSSAAHYLVDDSAALARFLDARRVGLPPAVRAARGGRARTLPYARYVMHTPVLTNTHAAPRVRLMLDADLKTEVLQATEARLADNVDLHAALLPMAPRTHGGVNHGDSLARVLLNVTCVQQEVAALLLQKLPELVVCAAASLRHTHTRSTHSTPTQGAAVGWQALNGRRGVVVLLVVVLRRI